MFTTGWRRLAAVVFVIALAAAACGNEDDSSGAIDTGADPTTTTTSTPGKDGKGSPAPPDGEVDTIAFEVWFTEGERLHESFGTHPATPAVGRAAIEALLAGPNESGLGTAVPDDTRLLGLNIDDGIATIDLSGEFESGGGSFSMRMRLAQIVFTLTQFPTVDGVELMLDGKAVDVFSGEGIVIEDPMRRADFEELAPPIVVELPRPGTQVTSPVVVAGNANVFEATVSIRIVTTDGEELVTTFTTATCGTGCRGTYSEKVVFNVDAPTEAIIEVFESSAEDGSPMFVVSVPVTLLP